jgi:hypothetical protein
MEAQKELYHMRRQMVADARRFVMLACHALIAEQSSIVILL